MEDQEILQRIGLLVDREHHLEAEHGHAPLEGSQLDELHDLEVQLDQCWDLLAQRRARRSAGQNPNDAHVRPAGTVENYKQ